MPRIPSLSWDKNRRATFRDQHGAPIAGKKQDSILQVAENPIEISLQSREDLFHITDTPADALNLGGNARRHILAVRIIFVASRAAVR